MGRCVGRTIRGRARRLFPANADTVVAATAFATLRQAFDRASTVVDAQPLGLPGQKVAGNAPVSDGRQMFDDGVRRFLVIHRIVYGS